VKRACAVAFVIFLALVQSWGHGDVHLQIEEVTKQIEKEPRNALLYLKRGELFRAHGEWDSALADFERVGAIDPKLDIIDFSRGKVFFEANWPQSAKIVLDRFLARHTNHVDALSLRARCQVKLGQRLAAARDFTSAIGFSDEPQPELYLERAQALTDEGPAHYQQAMLGLEEGIKKLGPLITFQLYAIDLELKQKQYDTALARLEKVSAASPRKETWLARKGEILQLAGHTPEACEAFRAALKAISQLPEQRRNVPAMVELEKRVKAVLEALEKNRTAQSK
jgi:tetratricopeptide (TPR) repeat protein